MPASVDWFAKPTAERTGLLNLSYNALDRHVIRGLGDESALLQPQAPAGARSRFTYADLLEHVGQLAGGLRELGVRPGRAVLVALPLVPELVVVMLACARMGAVAVPVATDPLDVPASAVAGHHELAVALVDGAHKAALAAALDVSGASPQFTVVLRPEAGSLDTRGDVDYAAMMRPGQFEAGVCAELAPGAALLALPSGVVHDHGWTLELADDARARGLGPGSYVSPSDWGQDDAPYAALLAPLLVGATVELR